MNETINWLLKGEPWVEYSTRLDLMSQSSDDKEVIELKRRIISHSKIQSMLT